MRLVVRPGPGVVLSVVTTSGQILGNADVESIVLDLPPTASGVSALSCELITDRGVSVERAKVIAGGPKGIIRVVADKSKTREDF